MVIGKSHESHADAASNDRHRFQKVSENAIVKMLHVPGYYMSICECKCRLIKGMLYYYFIRGIVFFRNQ